jgi:predicted component of type VI protein secretion system
MSSFLVRASYLTIKSIYEKISSLESAYKELTLHIFTIAKLEPHQRVLPTITAPTAASQTFSLHRASKLPIPALPVLDPDVVPDPPFTPPEEPDEPSDEEPTHSQQNEELLYFRNRALRCT